MSQKRALPRLSSTRARWAVPAVVAVAVAAAFLTPPLFASADESKLPTRTPDQLVTAVAKAGPTPLSGTVVYTARLGLPEIPFGKVTGADPVALLSGSSTMRVWSDGGERSRVALLGATSEFSAVRDGAQAWTYSSTNDKVVHYALSAADTARYDALRAQVRSGTGPAIAGNLPTPAEAADAALGHAGEFSTVTAGKQTTVAGRAAYQLVITPKVAGSLVDRIVVAIDGQTSTPVRVQTWSTQDVQKPALEIGFTDLSFATPDDAVLTFSPPAGATVTGTGWESVVTLTGVDVAALIAGDPAALATVPGAKPTIGSTSAQGLIEEFAPKDGSGAMPSLDTSALYDQLTTAVPEGRLLSSTLLSVLVTKDGRVLVGSVSADTLRAMA
jgi:outer membrane lipoprotein-sorting protein